MKVYAPDTGRGRTVAVDDIHHATADQPKSAADSSAKTMRKAARQKAKRDIQQEQPHDSE